MCTFLNLPIKNPHGVGECECVCVSWGVWSESSQLQSCGQVSDKLGNMW